MQGHAMAEITDNARRVLEARYLCRDKQGQVVETPEQMFRRVAHHLAQVEMNEHLQRARETEASEDGGLGATHHKAKGWRR